MLGSAPGARFGASLSFVEQILFVGAPGPDAQAGGKLYAVTSPTAPAKLVLDGAPLGALIGDVAPAGIGSPNGNLAVVSAPRSGSGGKLFVIEQNGGALGKVIATVQGPKGSLLGASLSQAADFDGDGSLEIAVGAPGYDQQRGTLFFLQASGKLIESGLSGGVIGTQLGSSVSRLADLNADGLSELGVALASSHFVLSKTKSLAQDWSLSFVVGSGD
jgi:hypothetical protein